MNVMKDLSKLNELEKEFLINWFMYYLSMDQRYKLMTDHPVIYNKLVNEEIMIVTKRERV